MADAKRANQSASKAETKELLYKYVHSLHTSRRSHAALTKSLTDNKPLST
jgi:hypothetical protein